LPPLTTKLAVPLGAPGRLHAGKGKGLFTCVGRRPDTCMHPRAKKRALHLSASLVRFGGSGGMGVILSPSKKIATGRDGSRSGYGLGKPWNASRISKWTGSETSESIFVPDFE